MGKSVSDSVLDGMLAQLQTPGVSLKQVLCSAQPTTYAQALTTYALAGDLPSVGASANGVVSGRRCTIAALNNILVDNSGTGTHVALIDTGLSQLLYVTTCTSVAVTQNSTVSFSAWDVEVLDPS